MDVLIDKYFGFLAKDFGFKGPIAYSYSRELHVDFVNKDIIVKIAYDGDYWVNIIKTKAVFPDLETGKTKVVNIDSKHLHYYSLGLLDPKKELWNSVSSDNFPDKSLRYYLNIIKKNPELLNGNFEKFSLWYRIRKIFIRTIKLPLTAVQL